jgi:thiosulfate/3-mercaptopyruvate sulfurtransferase
MSVALVLSVILGAAEVPLLVSTDSLAEMSGVLIVDTRSEAEFKAGHIPGAVSMETAALSEAQGDVQGVLKPVDDVAAMLAARGIAPDRHVVVYSAMVDPGDLRDATRMFWILEYLGFERVSLLDGGFAKWRAEERPVSEGGAVAEPVAEWTPEPHEARVATLNEVEQLLESGTAQFLDNRSNEQFRGWSKSSSAAAPGRLAGASNIPTTDFVSGPQHTMRPVAEIEAALSELGLDAEEPVVTYCNTGRSASVGYFAARLMGRDNVVLYDGSMSEWSQSGMPLVCDDPVEQ